jgi:DNA-binding IclR family transcriptional regulator
MAMSAVQSDISTPSQGIQVIARAAAVLRVLKEDSEGLSLGQIAARVGLPRSTVQRIINALLAEKLVMMVAPARGYRLGPEIQALAASCRAYVADMVRPYIAALAQKTGETVDLAELRHDHMAFIDQVIGTQRLRTVATVGEEFPLVSTANGKASLALLDDECLLRLVARELPAGKRAEKDFLRELAAVRRQGCAYDLGQHTPGISAVGAAFRDSNQQIYAVSIPVPTPRFVEHQAALTGHLLATVREIQSLFEP